MTTPADRKYTKEHEWIQLDGNLAKIGITFHAQEALGDIVFVELPAVGDHFDQGDSIAVVESVKAVSNIYTCVGGTVTQVNEELDAAPELLNDDPYSNFIAAIEVEAIAEEELLDAAAYDEFVASEA